MGIKTATIISLRSSLENNGTQILFKYRASKENEISRTSGWQYARNIKINKIGFSYLISFISDDYGAFKISVEEENEEIEFVQDIERRDVEIKMAIWNQN